MSISSQKLLRNTSETFDDLKDSAVVSETDNEEFITERSITSMSNECLPDPSNIDIPDTHSGKYFLLFLSSPIACVACERTELLRTEISVRRRFFCCPSKLF